MKPYFGWLLAGLLLAGCASPPELNAPLATPAASVQDQAFETGGRLAVNYQGKGEVASFDWQHAPERDQLDVKTPIGNTVASLSRDRHGVTLKANGKEQYAADVETLTEATLTRHDQPHQGYVAQGHVGVHSEHLSYLLGEMQSLARAHPGATW